MVVGGFRMPARPSQPPPRGQHWLVDRAVLSRLAEAAKPAPDSLMVEIGPGRGHLTDYLLASPAGRILAIEIDPALAAALERRYRDAIAAGRLQLETADCRRYDWSRLPAGWQLCANIPYYLTAYLLRQLTEIDNQPSRAVLLLPQPVAAKLAGGQGSLLAVIAGAQYQIDLSEEVPATAFEPPPRVRSQVVCLRSRGPERELAVLQDWGGLCRLWRQGFARPRQSLSRNLRAAGYDRQQLAAALSDLGLPKLCRPGDLSRRQWLELWGAVRPRPESPGYNLVA